MAIHYKKIIFITILLLVSTGISFSQNREIDSLYRLLEKSNTKQKLNLFHQIHVLTFSDNPELALKIANQSINLAISTNNTESLIRSYQDKSACFMLMNEYDSALIYVYEGKKIAQERGKENDIASCTELQGSIYWYKSDFKKALDYYIESSRIFEKTGDSTRIYNIYLNLGILNYSTGDYEKAIEYYCRAYKIIDTTYSLNDAALCLNNLGLIYQEWGDRKKALSYFLKALEFNKRNNDKRDISSNLNNIGSIYLEEGNYTKALYYYRQGLYLDVEIENQYGIGLSYISLCTVFEKQLQTDSVFYYATKAEEIFTRINNEQGLAQVYFHKGEGYFIRKNFKNSINEYLKSIDLSRKINDLATLSKSLSSLGISYYKTNDFENALIYLSESTSLTEENNAVFLTLKNYEYIANSYNKLNDKSLEVEFLRKYLTLKDSIFSLEKEKMASELLVKYEVEKTEAELEIQTKEKIINRNKFERQRTLTFATGIVLFLSIFIVFLLYKRYRQKQKTNDILNKHSIEIKQKQKEIKEQNIKLEEQAKSLQEIDNLKTRFFSNISHEFRTPLSLIIGPLESIIPKTKNEQLKSQLNLMLRNACKLFDLINQILDLSKIDKGSLKVKLQYGDITKEIGFITELFTSYARERNLKLIDESGTKEIKGYFDREKLEKILNNLISNAIKNTNKGEIRVRVKLKEKEEIVLKVMDTGQGIADEDLPYIFDRFYMAEGKNASNYIGSGIGLAFTKELVQLLRGNISVISVPDKGTTFTVTLPINKSVFNDNEYILIEKDTNEYPIEHIKHDLELNNESLNIEHKPGSPESVLVVEDHDELRSFICNNLSDKYKILQAVNGEDGIEKAVKNHPSIIITDITMPKIDGIELTKTLKNNEETSHIPIIILTAKASKESKIIGLKTRADDYLCKPFNIEELKVRIDNLLSIRQKLREKYIRSIEVNPSEITTNSIDEKLIARVLKVVEENMSNSDFSVEILCNILGISRSYLHNKLKSLLNQSATEFINTIRVKRAAQLIRQNAGNVSEIAYDVGFSSLSYFTKTFKKHFKVTPSEMLE